MRRGREFYDVACSTDKPVVVLKGGRSSYGAKAAHSHTAALAQNDEVLDAALRQAHVIRVHDMFELMDVARCLSVGRPQVNQRARIAVLSFSGGAGVVSSDDIMDLKMELAKFEDLTLEKIRSVFPEWMEPSNPVDLYPAMEKNGPLETYRKSIEAVMQDPGVDAVFLHLFAPLIRDRIYDYDQISELMKIHHKPVVAWNMGHSETAKEVTAELQQRGIPVLGEIKKGLRVLRALTMRR
jgi:acetyltransferase